MHVAMLNKRDGASHDDFFLRLLSALLRAIPFQPLRSDGRLGIRVLGTSCAYTVDLIAGSVERSLDDDLISILDVSPELVEAWKVGANVPDVALQFQRGELRYRGEGSALEDLLRCLRVGLSLTDPRSPSGTEP